MFYSWNKYLKEFRGRYSIKEIDLYEPKVIIELEDSVLDEVENLIKDIFE
jgi:hypothetical protein